MRLAGKVAVVTGAAGGIGAAVCRRFAAEGCSVVASDRKEEGLDQLVSSIVGAGGTATGVVADVSSEGGNALVVAMAAETFGGLDIFHANAAVQVMGGVEAVGESGWNEMFRVNLLGVASGFRHAIPELRRRDGGSLIATASLLGLVGDPDLAAYGAMKGGVRSLCHSMAASLGPEGIRVNTICPGDVETTMLREYFLGQPDPIAARKEITDRYPLRRFATPQDVANAALFLASDESSYISGTDIVVDGGLLARIY